MPDPLSNLAHLLFVFLLSNFFFFFFEVKFWHFFQEGGSKRALGTAGRHEGEAARTSLQTIYPTQYRVMTM